MDNNFMLPHIPKELVLKSICVFIPNSLIGAIIGAKGAYVKLLQQLTCANVTVEPDKIRSKSPNQKIEEKPPKEHSEFKDDFIPPTIDQYSERLSRLILEQALDSASSSKNSSDDFDRLVTIAGYDDDIIRALFWVYQRSAEVRNVLFGSMVLRVEFLVPSSMAGMIIGKNGQHINELRRMSHRCDINVGKNFTKNEAKITLQGCFGQVVVALSRINFLRKCMNREKMFQQSRQVKSRNQQHFNNGDRSQKADS
ncbi:unnamed protein product [Bursaphelenchus xylophilus]|uniref:(pine wood nematode) hypothetical protein n=1 Tax=Bursaphelenchus xylophilus TaxID=6326 RepID=A0A1I7SQD8_BURXY|nr:unnamed protein product [Bursaphelenchus xylophilus]CAG9109763.1 unnamed protein product [Bursaphelenchus xylophilus]